MKIGKIWAVLLVILIMSGCSGSKMSEPQSNSTPAPMAAYDAEAPMMMERQSAESYDLGAMSGGAMANTEEGYTTAVSGAGALPTDVSEADRKIIKTAWLSVETYDYDGSAKKLLDTVLIYGGYVQNADVSAYIVKDNESLKRGTYVLRVPQEHFETAKDEIEKIGKVISSGMGGDDVTSQYYDIESRMNIKKEEEKRIIDMIAKAEKIEDLIKLEEKLSEIRTDIEIYQTRLNSIDRLSSFSTITVDLTEVREKDKIIISEEDFTGKLKSAFIASINSVISFFKTLILFVATISVPALIVCLIGFIVWKFARKKVSKK